MAESKLPLWKDRCDWTEDEVAAVVAHVASPRYVELSQKHPRLLSDDDWAFLLMRDPREIAADREHDERDNPLAAEYAAIFEEAPTQPRCEPTAKEQLAHAEKELTRIWGIWDEYHREELSDEFAEKLEWQEDIATEQRRNALLRLQHAAESVSERAREVRQAIDQIKNFIVSTDWKPQKHGDIKKLISTCATHFKRLNPPQEDVVTDSRVRGAVRELFPKK